MQAMDPSTGEVVGACYGPVWAGLPQTSPMSELVAAVVISQQLDLHANHVREGGVQVASDNLATVGYINAPPAARQLRKYHHAGVLRDMILNAGFSSMAGRAFHVKSHQIDENSELRDTLPWTDLMHLIGND